MNGELPYRLIVTVADPPPAAAGASAAAGLTAVLVDAFEVADGLTVSVVVAVPPVGVAELDGDAVVVDGAAVELEVPGAGMTVTAGPPVSAAGPAATVAFGRGGRGTTPAAFAAF